MPGRMPSPGLAARNGRTGASETDGRAEKDNAREGHEERERDPRKAETLRPGEGGYLLQRATSVTSAGVARSKNGECICNRTKKITDDNSRFDFIPSLIRSKLSLNSIFEAKHYFYRAFNFIISIEV